MSSSFANLHRALSPSIDALTHSVIASSFANVDHPEAAETLSQLSNELLRHLHQKVTDSRSVDAVIDCVPSDYRPAI
jgi:hypothetical protein